MKKIFLALCALMTLALSCKKEDNQPAPPVTTLAPGFGPSTAAFSGANWQLPQGIELKDSIREAAWWEDVHGGAPIPGSQYRGLPGGTFMVCIYLQNTTGGAITIDFPEELLILSNTVQAQNGLIINLETVTIPAHSEIVIKADVFCINLTRSIPDLYTDDGVLQAFSFGPATVPPAIREITDILKPKNISYADMLTPDGILDPLKLSQMMIVQMAIWEVTDGDGLESDTKADLQDLQF